MAYFWFKSFHLIGVVVWFAGLFYLVRLFVYHAEASQQSEPAQTPLQHYHHPRNGGDSGDGNWLKYH